MQVLTKRRLAIALLISVACVFVAANHGVAEKGKSASAAPPVAAAPKQPAFEEEESPAALKTLPAG